MRTKSKGTAMAKKKKKKERSFAGTKAPLYKASQFKTMPVHDRTERRKWI